MHLRSLLLVSWLLGSSVFAEDGAQRFYLPPSSDAPAGNTEASAKLFEAAQTAADKGAASTAYQLAYQSLHEDPQSAAARKLLGFVKFRDQWHTPFAVKQLGADKVWSQEFGWLPKDSLERYQTGERYYNGRWMPADVEAKLRTKVTQGWRVDSEHFQVLTNHSLAAGVELSEQLERFHCIWWQRFAGYVLDDAELKRRFSSKPAVSRGIRQHRVICYRTRDEYIAALQRLQPQIGVTVGYYLDSQRTAYFFAGEEQDPRTLWHEATHQLFSESRPTVNNIGVSNNFWAVEAVACYMESLQEHLDQGYVTLGEPNAGRLPAARMRIDQDFYIPLAEIAAMSRQELQTDPRIAQIYSQIAGQATFFLEADDGKYREQFVAYLRSIYDGRAGEYTLSRIMDKPFAELDADYHRWIKALPIKVIPAEPKSATAVKASPAS